MKTKQEALKVLNMLRVKQKQYKAINLDISILQPTFPTYLQLIESELESAVVRVLDDILGDKIASYWLYDIASVDGGFIKIDNKEYTIKTFKDVIEFVNRKK